MTKEELKTEFNAKFTETDAQRNTIVKASAEELINWIADKFCNPEDTDASSLFSKAFTGMYDKNKKPIHEGDSIRLYYKGDYVICKVIYDLKHAAFFLKWPDGYVNQYFMNASNYEVVGNK